MRQELENIEYIERYLEGSLSKADEHKFKQYMQNDAGFKAAVDLQRQITTQLKEDAFLTDVSAYHQDFLALESKKQLYKKGLISSILILSVALLAWWYWSTRVITLTSAPLPPTPSAPSTSNAVPATSFEEQIKPFETAFISKKITARQGATISLKHSKSTLYIPPYAVVDSEGNPVKGTYNLEYRELRDRAQMAFSDLPMEYKNHEGARGFNSAGMLEVRAFKEGEELFIAPQKALTLDYEVNKRMSNLDLYHLDDEKQTWTKASTTVKLPKKGAYTESFDSAQYKMDMEAYEEKFKRSKKDKPQLNGSTWNVSTILVPKNIEKLEEEERPDPNKYVVKHYDNPRLIKDLQLQSFGVYNCSQTYQVENQIAVAAQYTDQQKVLIENARTLSIIDMNYNAAYSFKPAQFICNSEANNVFLLWSDNGKLYAFVKRSTVKMSTGNYSFQMEDLSEKIKDTKDLKRYLKFVDKKTKETVTKID